MRGIEDASVGTIICTSVFEHVENPFAAAYHVARVMRPGGKLFVSVPFKFSFHQQPDDYWRFTTSALRLLFGVNYNEIACEWFQPDGCYFYGTRKPEANEDDAARCAESIKGTILEAESRFIFRNAITAKLGGEIVELGTYLGKSCSVLCHVAAGLGKLPYTIDDYSYKNPTSPEIVGKNLRRLGLNAHIIKSDSCIVPDGVKSVSVLFIDSLHTAEHFNAECDVWLPRVVRGGVVICDDYEHTKWREMKSAIDARLGTWHKLGQETKMIAFRKP
jgi:predicted O-methyltransferase YrrM